MAAHPPATPSAPGTSEALEAHAAHATHDTPEMLDVAIVGGGVSGLYSAWRLLEAAPRDQRPRITVFEGSQRVGGRLLSLTPPGMPHTRCELGGMRYMSRHRLVAALVQRFDVKTEPMPVSRPENIAYLRGKLLRQSDLAVAAALPYNLDGIEQSMLSHDDLLMWALTQIVPNAKVLAGRDFAQLQVEMQSACFDGVPLHQQGFWNVLARILSPDALAFIRDSGGYDCLVSNWSAADAIPFILADFGSGVSYSRLPDGFDRIPQRLADEVRAAGAAVALGACLRSFDVQQGDNSGHVVLHFACGQVVRARRLILAMPRRSLELLEPSGAVMDKRHRAVRALIESVEPIPLFKIFVCYPYPWWTSAGVSTGRTLTDLPIRQCYYWGTEARDADTPGNSALLASYDDDLSVNFWAGLRRPGADRSAWPPRPRRPGDADPSEDWAGHEAPPAMVAEVHRQLVEMHGMAYAPQPYASAYRDWAEDPFGGGVNFWRIHAKSWEVIPAMLNPVPGLPVYVCGEAYSHEQGWVEGALQTAELMLTRHFHLPPLLPIPPAGTGGSAAGLAKSRTEAPASQAVQR